jgi:hypothetical protein
MGTTQEKAVNYDVNVYTWVSSTLNASSVGTLINTAGKLFHVRIAEGKYEFWWLCIMETGYQVSEIFK